MAHICWFTLNDQDFVNTAARLVPQAPLALIFQGQNMLTDSTQSVFQCGRNLLGPRQPNDIAAGVPISRSSGCAKVDSSMPNLSKPAVDMVLVFAIRLTKVRL